MILSDVHTHTTWCDGQNTPVEMAEAALARGMTCLGFSGHGYAPYDTDACMSREGQAAYREEVNALKSAYAGRLRILCGVEQDALAPEPAVGFDYIIGSAHYVPAGEALCCVDNTPAILVAAVNTHFGGDWYALCEAYYQLEAQVLTLTGADIIGHFDLVTKFNEKHHFFDENHPRYIRAWQAAADELLKTGKPFEINTGAISRGWRTEAYPARPIRDYIHAHGGKLMLNSDSHRAETLCYQFDRYESEADIVW